MACCVCNRSGGKGHSKQSPSFACAACNTSQPRGTHSQHCVVFSPLAFQQLQFAMVFAAAAAAFFAYLFLPPSSKPPNLLCPTLAHTMGDAPCTGSIAWPFFFHTHIGLVACVISMLERSTLRCRPLAAATLCIAPFSPGTRNSCPHAVLLRIAV